MILDEKLDFKNHLKEKCSKFNKGVGVIRKLQSVLPRKSLLTIYKSFVRPHLDYGDIINLTMIIFLIYQSYANIMQPLLFLEQLGELQPINDIKNQDQSHFGLEGTLENYAPYLKFRYQSHQNIFFKWLKKNFQLQCQRSRQIKNILLSN